MTDVDAGDLPISYQISPHITDEDLNSLFAAAWPDHAWSAFQPMLSRSLAYICAYQQERLIGFVNLAWDGGIHAFLLNTTVHADFLRRGIGRALVGRAAELARTRGIVWLHVDYEPQLEAFYRGCGFRHTEAGLMRLTPQHADAPIDTFSTARLLARRPHADDFATLNRLYQDPRVMARLSADGRPLSEAAARQRLSRHLDYWEQYGYGIWLFHTRDDGRFVGYCGLKLTPIDATEELEVLYAVVSDEWRQGFANEMAASVVALAFERFERANIVAFTLHHNQASRRVMERAGFTYERDIVHAELPHVLYRLQRNDWRR